jgi:hypothetical protein
MSYFEKKSQLEDGGGTDITSTPEGSKQALDVNIANTTPLQVVIVSASGLTVNVFSEVDAPYATETTILSYTVPITKILDMTSAVGWGTFDGEFLIRIDGTLVGGGRTSAAQRNWVGNYISAPLMAVAGHVVTISITHYSTSVQHFRANLLGGLN